MKFQPKKMKITQLLTEFAQLLTDFVDVEMIRKHTKLWFCSENNTKNHKKLNNVQQKTKKIDKPTKKGM